MERFTTKINGKYVANPNTLNLNDDGYSGEAIDKLAKFENIIDEILLEQSEISKELEMLRNKEQIKSYRFRQLLGHKLTNSALITKFEEHKLI